MRKTQTILSKETYNSPLCVAMAFSAETAILSVSGTGNIDSGTGVDLGTLSVGDVTSDFNLLPGANNLLF